MQVGVHARLEDGDSAESLEFGRMRIIIERTRDQHVEPASAASRAARTSSLPRHRAELRPDEDAGAPLRAALPSR